MHAVNIDLVAFLLVFALLSGAFLGTRIRGKAGHWYKRNFRPITLRELPAVVRAELRR